MLMSRLSTLQLFQVTAAVIDVFYQL